MSLKYNSEVYLTYDEAMKELGFTKQGISMMVTQGRLQSYKLGYTRNRYVKKSDIDQMKVLTPVHRAG